MLIEPHSSSFCCNHGRETGLVMKSLHPAANAANLSDCNDEAVRATMMTGREYGDMIGLGVMLRVEVDLGGLLNMAPSSVVGVTCWKPAMLLARSISRISSVASMPLFTGS